MVGVREARLEHVALDRRCGLGGVDGVESLGEVSLLFVRGLLGAHFLGEPKGKGVPLQLFPSTLATARLGLTVTSSLAVHDY